MLVFTKTAGYRHESILAGVTALKALGAERGWSVIHTESSAAFTPRYLARFKVVVWLNTTGDVLHAAEQRAFKAYIESGGGYVGIHSAADTEYGWDWYGELLGARFKGHPGSPNVRNADIVVEKRDHPATATLPERWNRDDEWYNFKDDPRQKLGITVLAALDEKTYSGGAMGDHPIVWCQQVGKGRAFYTALGHTAESYADPLFRRHLAGAIAWAGDVQPRSADD